MTKTEVSSIVKDEINKFIKSSLDKEIKNVLSTSNSKSREELVKTITNALEGVYKVLWQKRDFWKKDIK